MPGSAWSARDAAQDSGAADHAGRWEVLTSREREVAMLVAKSMTNKEIAARLFVSKRTVDAHIEHILAKLSYASRVQIAALVTSEQAQVEQAQVEQAQVEQAQEEQADGDEESAYQVPVPRASQEHVTGAGRPADRGGASAAPGPVQVEGEAARP